ncbi:MAG: NUDIX hydrolase [Cyclobacteriaceae bacterium]|nr:NUDIX hydrolase [Cyclobacteriaceae bacterium]
MNEVENPWQKLSSKEIYDNPWITIHEHEVINPGGGRGIYGKVSFKNTAVGIIPLDNNMNTWLVGQYRYPLDEYSWEIPMGGGPIENDILDAAKSELKEETGITASKWENIMRIHTSNSITDEQGFVFLARELEFGERELEESESDLKLWKLPFSDVVEMVMENKITDSISVAGILKVEKLLKS